jgi:serine protease Do
MARWSMAFVFLAVGGLLGSFVAGPILRGQNAAATPVAVPKELTSYRDVVKGVLPAVVSIEGHAKPRAKAKAEASPRRRTPFDDSTVPEEFRRFFEEMEKRQLETPDEVPNLGFGSGFLVDPKGVILTNYHVVAGADEVQVQLKDGRKFRSKDIHGDRKTDLAIVRIHSQSPLPFLDLGDSDAMEIGDRVLAVGAPFGLTGSVTAGIVSAKGRNGLNVNMYEDFIQTDAAINPGNSGGPLVNLDGKVIGISSAIKSRTGGFQGVGLAIASNLAKNIMHALERDGLVHRGYLGVQMGDLSPDVAAQLHLKEGEGVVVRRVFEGSPAGKAGLQEGDIVTSLANKPIKDGKQLQQVVATLPLHKPVELQVVRDGQTKDMHVTIEEQPEEFGTVSLPRSRAPREESDAITLDKMGLELQDLTADAAEQLGFRASTTGALITKVVAGSLAADAGLVRGMVITKVGSHSVKTADVARDYLERGSLSKGILLQVQSARGGTSYVVLKSEPVK